MRLYPTIFFAKWFHGAPDWHVKAFSKIALNSRSLTPRCRRQKKLRVKLLCHCPYSFLWSPLVTANRFCACLWRCHWCFVAKHDVSNFSSLNVSHCFCRGSPYTMLLVARVGHRVLFRSERILLFRSFKARNVLLCSFFEFLATYQTQKNDAFFS